MKSKNKITNDNSRLDKLDKKFPYEIPQGYFDTFPERMEQKISETEDNKSRIIDIKSIYQLLPAAAVIIVFIVASVLFLNEPVINNEEYDVSNISFDNFAYLSDADIYESDLFLEYIQEEVSEEEYEAYVNDVLAEDILLEYYFYEDEEILELLKNF